jgi:hypothetical protein
MADLPTASFFEAPPEPEPVEPTEPVEPAAVEPEPDVPEVLKPPKENLVPQGRLNKVVAERNELRTELSTVEAALQQARVIAGGVAEHYGKFDHPEKQISYDQRYMTHLEELSHTNPAVAAAVKVVNDVMESPMATEDTNIPAPAPAPEPAAPAVDPRIDNIVESHARGVVEATLSGQGLLPHMVEIIGDYVIGAEGDKSTLTPGAVVEFTKQFVKERGLTPEQILVDPGVKDTPTPPPTSSGNRAPGTKQPTPEQVAEEAAKAPDPITNRDAWQADRNKRIAQFFDGDGK